jgi:hypothetical protein
MENNMNINIKYVIRKSIALSVLILMLLVVAFAAWVSGAWVIVSIVVGSVALILLTVWSLVEIFG